MIRKRRFQVVAATVVVAALAGGTYALAAGNDGPGQVPQTDRFHTDLNGFQEVPSISTQGFGELDAKLVDETTLHYVFTYAGLEGGASLFAHIHVGQRSVNGGVSVFLCGGDKPPCTPVAGTFEGDITPANVVGPTGQGVEPVTGFAELIRMMRAGHSYANIHTTRWPGGEIRGQINNRDQREFVK
jgi:CHRD domain